MAGRRAFIRSRLILAAQFRTRTIGGIVAGPAVAPLV